MDRNDWIIAIHSSRADGISLYRFRGTVEEARKEILALIDEDKENDADNWGYGTETISEVQVCGYHELHGYGQYKNYRNAYTAVKFAHIDHLKNIER